MSKVRRSPGTHSEKSSWTPINHVPSNEKIFEERMSLIKKWYAAWNETQRWSLLEYILLQLDDEQLLLLQSLLDPVIPPADHDFTRTLPRFLCLRIFSLLDPQSLCRAAQVCWYWKYLTECNEIWQEKCLRLGWFLPAPPPPHVHDYTLWKRHYIQCVSQLHWNPPQRPGEEEAEDEEGGGGDEEEAADQSKRRKKRRAPRHCADEDAKKPWRDPDPRPSDTHFQYGPVSPCLALYSSFPALRSKTHNMETVTPTPLPILPLATPIVPPTSLLHPSLMEKLRLGSPTPAHMDLTTLNHQQTDDEINKTLYDIQEMSPFPKLPPYFVHQAEDIGSREDSERSALRPASDSTPPHAPRKKSVVMNATPPTTTTGGGNVRGKDSTGKSSRNRDSQGKRKAPLKELELPTQAWHIPTEDDEWP